MKSSFEDLNIELNLSILKTNDIRYQMVTQKLLEGVKKYKNIRRLLVQRDGKSVLIEHKKGKSNSAKSFVYSIQDDLYRLASVHIADDFYKNIPGYVTIWKSK